MQNFNEMTVVEKINYFKGEQAEIVALRNAWQKKVEVNKAEVNAAFGFLPDEPVSVINMLDIFATASGENDVVTPTN